MGPLLGALGGAGLGAVAGGLAGALTKTGVPEEESHYYAEGVRRGDAIVTVHATTASEAERALRIMNEAGAIDIAGRVSSWRHRGWTGHNPGAEPLSEEELRLEREFYARRQTEKERNHAGDE